MSTGEYIELMDYGSCWDAILDFTSLDREEKIEPYFFLKLILYFNRIRSVFPFTEKTTTTKKKRSYKPAYTMKPGVCK